MLFCKVAIHSTKLQWNNGIFSRILSGGFPQIDVNNAFYSLKEFLITVYSLLLRNS